MLISSEAGAGQIVSRTEEPRFYDDIACLAAGAAAAAGETAVYVRPADGDDWIDAASARYARSAAARTPMGSGLLAYGNADAARAADRDRRALTWDDVRRPIR